MSWSWFPIIIFLIAGVTSQELDGTIRKLRKDLLQGYDKNARPVYNHQNTTTVEMEVHPLQIRGLDEEKSFFTADSWISMHWHDEHLKWKPEDYSGISFVHFADHEIWQPDIAIYNAAESEFDRKQNVFTIVFSDGQVMWIPPVKIHVICTLEYDNYPQDIQKCTAKFGSWTTDGNTIDLKLGQSDLSEFWDNNPYWKLVAFDGIRKVTHYPCCEEPYVSLFYTFIIQRRGTVAQLPCRLLRTTSHILMLCMFWFPADSYHKFRPGLFGIISLIVALCVTTKTVNTPAAMQVALSSLTTEFVAALAAIIVEVIIFNISNIRDLQFPAVFQFASRDLFKKLFCVFIKSSSTSKYNPVEAATENMDEVRLHVSSEPVDSKKGWFTMATILDRLSFVIFIIVFISVGSYI